VKEQSLPIGAAGLSGTRTHDILITSSTNESPRQVKYVFNHIDLLSMSRRLLINKLLLRGSKLPRSFRTFYGFLAGLHKVHPAYRMVNAGQAGGRLLIGYLLCVMNSFHTFKLTFFKLCTVVMDTLKICM
jgi:hypothetical protein